MTLVKNWKAVPVAQNYNDLYRSYGNPDDATFAREYLTDFELRLSSGTVQHVTTHVAMVDRLHYVVMNAGQFIHSCAGSFNHRPVRGGTHLSIHAWGLAIDINADTFPLGSSLRQVHALTVAFESQGFWYGGDFHHRKDPMHYQLAGDF